MLIVETKGAQRTLVTPIFDAPMHVQKARVVENAVIVCHRVITGAEHAQMEKLVAVLDASVPQEKNWHQGEGARNVHQENMEQTVHATHVPPIQIRPPEARFQQIVFAMPAMSEMQEARVVCRWFRAALDRTIH